MLPTSVRAVQEHYPLVRRVARALARRLPRSVDIEDLVGAGSVGLVDAATRFDPTRANFEHYATIRIRGAMRDYLRSLDWRTRTHRRRERVVDQAVLDLQQTLGRPPSEEELLERLGWTADQLAWSRVSARVTGLEADTLDEAEERTSSPTARLEQREVLRRLGPALAALSSREREVLALYYAEDMTLRAIGARYGVTESRVCQVHRTALLRLRAALERPEEACAAA